MSRAASLARDDRAGHLSPVRLGVRFASDPAPDRSEHGVLGALEWGEGRLSAGFQQIGPWGLRTSADLAGESAEFTITIQNTGDGAHHLESVVLGARWCGVNTTSLRYLKNGWQSWSATGSHELDRAGDPPFPSGPWLRGLHHPQGEPALDRAGWHESTLVSVARDADGRCCLAGALENGLSTGLVYWSRDAAPDLRVEVELHLGVVVDGGGTLELEPVSFALGGDESALLETFGETLGARSGARTHAALPTGWCSWYQFFHDVTEDDLLRNLEALSALRSEFAVDVVQLDDGYQRAIGDWLAPNGKFPRGIEPLAREIRAAGFRPGLWTAPFCAVEESQLFGEHRDWLLRSHAPGDELQRALLHPAWTEAGWVYALDTTRDDVIEHLKGTFRELSEMGFSYHKLDFLWAVSAQVRAGDPQVTAAQRLRRGLLAIREGVGPDGFLLGCGCPMGSAVGVVDAMRIGPDVAPHWGPSAGSPAGIEETLPSTRSALRSVLARVWMHRRLWINDPDCLMARTRGTELTEGEVDALAGAIAVTGGMVVVSDDLPGLGPADRRRVRDAIATAREIDSATEHGAARAQELLLRELPAGAIAHTAESCWDFRWNGSDEADATRTLKPHASTLLRTFKGVALAVFCDYDGTFAIQDVGSTLAQTYAADRREELWSRLSSGELNAWEYNMELLDGLELPEESLEAFLRTVDPTPGAAELVRWCEGHGVPFRILSDGFDRNLDRLQEIHGIRFAYRANHLWYEAGRWRLAAGGPNSDCSCGTGVCKAAVIEAFRKVHPEASVVHIGNGRVSDLCASEAADRVYAKDTLAEELAERGVPFEPFADLHDVRESLARLVG